MALKFGRAAIGTTIFSENLAAGQRVLDSDSYNRIAAAPVLSKMAAYKAPTTGFQLEFADAGTIVGVFEPLLIATTDNVPDSITGTNPTLTVGAATHVVSTIDAIGDQDFFKVDLTGGVVYEI